MNGQKSFITLALGGRLIALFTKVRQGWKELLGASIRAGSMECQRQRKKVF